MNNENRNKMNRMNNFINWMNRTIQNVNAKRLEQDIDVFETCLQKCVEAEEKESKL
jgi:ferritin